MAKSLLEEPLPRRVAIFRALQLGDLLCTIPALRAIRAALPRAEIVLIGLPWAISFVSRFDRYLDGFIEFPGYPGLPERPPQVGLIPAFLGEVQREGFDLAIQIHGAGTTTNPLVSLFGARRTAGFFQPGEYCPDPDRFVPYPRDGLELRRLLGLLQSLGVEPRGEELEFPIRGEDERAFTALPEARELERGSYVCVHPGASTPLRRWPRERFASVAEALAARGFRIVLTGTAGEASLTSAMARELGTPAIDLAGRTDLGSLAVLLSRARMLVCNDTGVSHVADALHVPSVVISTGDNPARWSPADRKRHRVLCEPEGVAAEDVIEHAEDLLRWSSACVDWTPTGPGRDSSPARGPDAPLSSRVREMVYT
jgi:ADP-heptose:LPS heptosyltransferase